MYMKENIKKIANICTLLACSVFLLSCNGFLDKSPLDKVSTDGDLSVKDVVAMVDAAYQPLQWPKLYNMRMWTTDIIAGNSLVGANGGTDGIETTDLANFTATSANAAAIDIWRGPNPGILRCNLALQTIQSVDMPDEIKNRCLGEAYFLRAHYYFILVRVFGDVPLVLTPPVPGTNFSLERTPKAAVYEQIKSDCQEAINLLPTKSSYDSENVGRASKDAALLMMAKIKLTLAEDYPGIVDLCDRVTALGYDLSKYAYADNFDATIDNNPESIFEIQYDGDASSSFWGNDNRASWLSTFMGPRNSSLVAGAWGWNQPTQEFVDNYEQGDLRKDVTLFYDGCPDFEGVSYDPLWSRTGYNVRKFVVPMRIASEYNKSPANFVVYRYADVLLMKAEALNEQGLTTEALVPLNSVRARAGLPAISNKTQSELKEIIIHERRMEFAFEGHRWFDLIRIDGGDYALSFLHAIGVNNATKERLLFPIPQEEIDDNPLMKQNSGY